MCDRANSSSGASDVRLRLHSRCCGAYSTRNVRWGWGAPAQAISQPYEIYGTASPARTGDPQIHNLVL
jgi:hypothetical protein